MFKWLHLIRDSRGKASWSHTIAIPIVIGITIKLLASGTDISLPGGIHVILASLSGSDYVEMVKYWIGLYIARETTEKVISHLENGNASSGS